MVRLPADLRRQLAAAAEAAYPCEACGLLIGRRPAGATASLQVTRIVPTRNIAADPRRRFEIDPAAQFHWLRTLRGTDEAVLGHYHSHPDAPATPSATDAAMAAGQGELWLILSVRDGQCRDLTLHQWTGQDFTACEIS